MSMISKSTRPLERDMQYIVGHKDILCTSRKRVAWAKKTLHRASRRCAKMWIIKFDETHG